MVARCFLPRVARSRCAGCGLSSSGSDFESAAFRLSWSCLAGGGEKIAFEHERQAVVDREVEFLRTELFRRWDAQADIAERCQCAGTACKIRRKQDDEGFVKADLERSRGLCRHCLLNWQRCAGQNSSGVGGALNRRKARHRLANSLGSIQPGHARGWSPSGKWVDAAFPRMCRGRFRHQASRLLQNVENRASAESAVPPVR